MKTYKATLDKATKTITLLVFIIVLIPIAIALLRLPNFSPGFLVSPVLLFILIGLYLYSITGYTITDNSLIINRRNSRLNKIIPLSDIESVMTHPQEHFRNGLRVFGNGGFFGYYGLFHNSNLGRFKMYGTRISGSYVVLKGKFKLPVVLTPDDISMADALEKHLKKIE